MSGTGVHTRARARREEDDVSQEEKTGSMYSPELEDEQALEDDQALEETVQPMAEEDQPEEKTTMQRREKR